MNSRERMLKTISHQEPDRVPLDLGGGKSCMFTRGFYVKLLDYLGLQEDIIINNKVSQLVQPSEKVMTYLGCDARSVNTVFRKSASSNARDWEDGGSLFMIDDWGTTYRMPKEQGLYYDMVDFPLAQAEDEADDARYAFPEPAKVDPECVPEAAAYRDQGYYVVMPKHFGNGFLQTGPKVYGFENWLMMLVSEPDRARCFLDQLLEKKFAYWTDVLDRYGDSIDVVSESDDLGTQGGPWLPPEVFKDLILPYHKALIRFIKSRSKVKFLLHSCGSVSSMLPQLVEAGVDILNPVQISATGMDPYFLKREFGRDLTFWGGGIDTQYMLPLGKPDEIRDHIKRNIDAFAPGGGFIFATVHNIQSDVPVENFMTMWEAFKENSRY